MLLVTTLFTCSAAEATHGVLWGEFLSNAQTQGQIVCFTRGLRTSKQLFRLPAAAEANSTLQSPVDLLDDGVPTLGSPSTFGCLTLDDLMVCINRC